MSRKKTLAALAAVVAVVAVAAVGFHLGGAGGIGANSSLGTTERVSVDSAENQGNDISGWATIGGDRGYPAISAGGRYIAFESLAANLVPGDTNGTWDVFVHDRQTGATERVSVDSAGNQANATSWYPAISADGRYVVFYSFASNLVPGDTNGFGDVFIHDRQTGATERVSVDSAGNQGNDYSGNGPSGAAVSGDGRYVAFQSSASNLVPGDTNGDEDVFVHDRQTGATERVSVHSDGSQGNPRGGYYWWEGSRWPAMSVDGRYVAFESEASNLVGIDTNGDTTCDVGCDTNGYTDVFVHDRETGTTNRASVDSAGNQGDWYSLYPAISADGRYVAFTSVASNLVPDDTNGMGDIFVRDRQGGTIELVTVDSAGNQGNGAVGWPSMSADGRYVAFASHATNLVSGDSNGYLDVFVHDRVMGPTERVSVDSAGNQANQWSLAFAISADGRYVAFASSASNLVPGDTNGAGDVFVRDRCPDGSCGGAPPTPTPPPDIGVTISDNPDPVVAGGIVTYSITVDNHGPGQPDSVTLFDVATAPVEWARTDAGVCMPVAMTVSCVLGPIPPGGSAKVDVLVKAPLDVRNPQPPVEAIVNVATAHAIGDAHPDDDTASETTTLQRCAPGAPRYLGTGDSVPFGADMTTDPNVPYSSAYPALYWEDLMSLDPQYCFANISQSGAKSSDYLNGSLGCDPNGPGYHSQTACADVFQPGVVTVTVGADDLVLPILKDTCLPMLEKADLRGARSCTQSLLQVLPRTHLTDRLKAIVQHHLDLGATVVVTNYYNPVPLPVGPVQRLTRCIPFIAGGKVGAVAFAMCMQVLKDVDATLGNVDAVIQELNRQISAAVRDVGNPERVSLVDLYSRFSGHCTPVQLAVKGPLGIQVAVNFGCPLADTWIAPLRDFESPSIKLGPISFSMSGKEGVHPNLAGHQNIADAVWEAGQAGLLSPRR